MSQGGVLWVFWTPAFVTYQENGTYKENGKLPLRKWQTIETIEDSCSSVSGQA